MSSFSHQHLHLDTEGDDTCQPLSPYSFKESSKSQDVHSSSSGISGHGWEHMKQGTKRNAAYLKVTQGHRPRRAMNKEASAGARLHSLTWMCKH